MERLRAVSRGINRWWEQRDPATRLAVQYIQRAIANFVGSGSRRAAALAYYTVFSIFPLTLILAIGVSRLLGSANAQVQISRALSLFLPEGSQVSGLILENIRQAMDQNTSFGVIALAGLVWAGLGLFTNLTTSLDQIFDVPESRSLWRQRLVALAMIFILVMLVLASFLTSGIIGLLSIFFLNRPSTWLAIASVFLPLSLNTVIFVLLFRFVPARTVSWDAIWPAALVGAIGFELAKRAFSWYLSNLANYQVVYGSIATVIVLLFWAYLLASILLFSAELCAQLNIWSSLRTRQMIYGELERSAPPQLTD